MARQVGLAGFAIASLLLASVGCTSGSRPNLSSAPAGTASSTVTSASPTAQPTPTNPYPADVPLTGHNVKPGEKPPLYPASAKVKSQAGANAFAEFFMKTLDWMYATTNPAYPKHYFAASCGLCVGLTTGMQKTASQAHWYEGGRFTVHSAIATQIAPVTAPADYCSSLVVDTTSESVVDKTGKIYSGDGAYLNLRFKACMTFKNSTWITTYLARP